MTSAVLRKPDYDVLNVVALKKMVQAPAIAEVCGRAAAEVAGALAGLSTQGLVVIVNGSALPTDDAGPLLTASAAVHYADVRRDPEVLRLVERFDEINSQFLTAMSAWQQVDVGGRKITNDHTDPEYDEKVITRIDRLIERLAPLLDALARHDSRFGGYRERLERAMTSVEAGRPELVSAPTVDSVHNVWFEFHEDLLRTLGREREQ